MPSGPRANPAVAAILALAFAGPASAGRSLNGFTLEPASIPIDEILRGGPQRDGIPALDSPDVLDASSTHWGSQERVIGVEVGGMARAYPLSAPMTTPKRHATAFLKRKRTEIFSRFRRASMRGGR